MPRAARPTRTNGTGLSECAVTGRSAASRSSSALPWSAVMASSAPGAAGSAASTASMAATIRARQLSRTSRAADCRVPDPRVADHVRVGVVGDDEVVATRRDRLHQGIGDTDRAHRRREIVGGDLGARDEEAVLARPGRLHATVEEVRHVGVLLGLGDVELAPAGLREGLGQRARLFGREGDLDRQACLVLGHRHDEQVGRRLAPGG